MVDDFGPDSIKFWKNSLATIKFSKFYKKKKIFVRKTFVTKKNNFFSGKIFSQKISIAKKKNYFLFFFFAKNWEIPNFVPANSRDAPALRQGRNCTVATLIAFYTT